MRNQNEQLRPGFVLDPHTGKVYNLTAFFKYWESDLVPFEELHSQIVDAIYDLAQGYDFDQHPQRNFKNACFLLAQLESLLRPMVLFNPDPVV